MSLHSIRQHKRFRKDFDLYPPDRFDCRVFLRMREDLGGVYTGRVVRLSRWCLTLDYQGNTYSFDWHTIEYWAWIPRKGPGDGEEKGDATSQEKR